MAIFGNKNSQGGTMVRAPPGAPPGRSPGGRFCAVPANRVTPGSRVAKGAPGCQAWVGAKDVGTWKL